MATILSEELLDYRCDDGWHYYKDEVKGEENCYYITNWAQPYKIAESQCKARFKKKLFFFYFRAL